MRVTILTKTDCVNCNRLKMFIEHALKPEQKSKIEYVLKEENETMYNELVNKYHVLAVPTAIFNEKAYPGIEPSKLTELINTIK